MSGACPHAGAVSPRNSPSHSLTAGVCLSRSLWRRTLARPRGTGRITECPMTCAISGHSRDRNSARVHACGQTSRFHGAQSVGLQTDTILLAQSAAVVNAMRSSRRAHQWITSNPLRPGSRALRRRIPTLGRRGQIRRSRGSGGEQPQAEGRNQSRTCLRNPVGDGGAGIVVGGGAPPVTHGPFPRWESLS